MVLRLHLLRLPLRLHLPRLLLPLLLGLFVDLLPVFLVDIFYEYYNLGVILMCFYISQSQVW